MNNTTQKILSEYKADSTCIKILKTSQQIWIPFRDAEMNAQFPKREVHYFGSVHAMCECMHLKEFTDERTQKLKKWLVSIEDGEVCTSSIKIISK
ncbi:MAG: DUF1311 domain-containing protein [Bacteroidetes bacterium]|nr:DUF1311 domain-containing protein [Bacteroidota bacterium]